MTARDAAPRTRRGPDATLVRRMAQAAPMIVVIGDLVADGWISGTSSRLARESPTPVVEVAGESLAAGGAANTAVNLAALGARVRMVGLVGDDDAGRALQTILRNQGVDTSGVVAAPGLATTSKTRVVVADQVMVRLDRAGPQPPPPAAMAQLEEAVRRAVTGAATPVDAVVISDYEIAVRHARLAPVLAPAPGRPLVVVDAHRPARWARLRPDVITPNAAEAETLLGESLGSGAARAGVVAERAADLLAASSAAQVLVTLDRDGTVLLRRGHAPYRTSARPAAESQAVGAGDTFVAALTAALACGVDTATASDLAQTAANVVVHRPDTSVCGTDLLVEALEGGGAPVVSVDRLMAEIGRRREHGQRVVLTNGCFDVLHRGHVACLEQAAGLGDVLVVAVNDDDSTLRLKGPGRPVTALPDRVRVLAALGSVDYVTVFSTDTPIPLIRRLHPDVYVKGGDYAPQMLRETPEVEAYGGRVHIVDYVPDHSTAALIERLRRPDGGEPAMRR